MVDRECLWRRIPGGFESKSFFKIFFRASSFSKISPLNDCLTSKISGSQKVQGQQFPAKLGYFFFDNFRHVWLSVVMLKIYCATGQALFNDFDFVSKPMLASPFNVNIDTPLLIPSD